MLLRLALGLRAQLVRTSGRRIEPDIQNCFENFNQAGKYSLLNFFLVF